MRAEIDLAPLDIDVITEFIGEGSENLMRRVLGADFDAPDLEARFEQALVCSSSDLI